ncbi:hypothetical protein HHL28_17080 [Aerophototrophica crusticola]|uniref:Cache domain-containing protein n=1 Tax=Aerophototrophica crusticola TaxID=1709002 RepID=A0A858RA53_9PROT|nr:hypothetical protein HHL28_17080 [Rhodospirillaceae bacterium B3]
MKRPLVHLLAYTLSVVLVAAGMAVGYLMLLEQRTKSVRERNLAALADMMRDLEEGIVAQREVINRIGVFLAPNNLVSEPFMLTGFAKPDFPVPLVSLAQRPQIPLENQVQAWSTVGLLLQSRQYRNAILAEDGALPPAEAHFKFPIPQERVRLLDKKVVSAWREDIADQEELDGKINELISTGVGAHSAKINFILKLSDMLDTGYASEFFDSVIVIDLQGNHLGSISRGRSTSVMTPALATRMLAAHGFNQVSLGKEEPDPKAFVTRDSVEVGGVRYRYVMIPHSLSMPAQVRSNNNAAEIVRDIYVLGLLPENEFQFEAARLRLSYAIPLVFGFILLLASWPFLKIALINPNERLMRADPILVALSLCVVVATFVVFPAWYHYRSKVQEALDGKATKIAQRIVDDFQLELKDSLSLLQKLEPSILEAKSKDKNRCFVYNLSRVEIDETKGLSPFNRAFALNWRGQQTGLQLFDKYQYAALTAPDREYFTTVARRLPWRLTQEVPADQLAPHMFVDVIRDRYAGGTAWVLSAPPSMTPTGPDQPDCVPSVMVLSRVMHTFFHPVLPPQFKFAVIDDRTGQVKVHSDPKAILSERLGADVALWSALQPALAFRTPDVFGADYRGSPHRFVTHPIKGLPWTMLVMYEQSIPDILAHNLAVTALGGTLLTVMLFAVLIGLPILMEPRRIRRRWLWPDQRIGIIYVCLSAYVGLVGAITLLVARGAGGFAGMFICLSGAILAYTTTRAMLGPQPKPLPEKLTLGSFLPRHMVSDHDWRGFCRACLFHLLISLLCALIAIGLHTGTGHWIFLLAWVVLASPALSTLGLVYFFGSTGLRGWLERRTRFHVPYHVPYVLLACSLVLVIAAVPAVVVLGEAADHEGRLLDAYLRGSTAQAMAERDLAAQRVAGSAPPLRGYPRRSRR